MSKTDKLLGDLALTIVGTIIGTLGWASVWGGNIRGTEELNTIETRDSIIKIFKEDVVAKQDRIRVELYDQGDNLIVATTGDNYEFRIPTQRVYDLSTGEWEEHFLTVNILEKYK